jgi:hypothetical protein
MSTVSSCSPDRLTLPNLRSLSRMTLAFRPPPDDGSGGRRTRVDAYRAGRNWSRRAWRGGPSGERLVRRRLRPAGWDALESPLIIAALGLSVGMAAPGNLRLAAGTDPEHPLVAGS